MTKRKLDHTTIRVPVELIERYLKTKEAARYLSIAEWVRDCLRHCLDQIEKKEKEELERSQKKGK